MSFCSQLHGSIYAFGLGVMLCSLRVLLGASFFSFQNRVSEKLNDRNQLKAHYYFPPNSHTIVELSWSPR